MKTIRMKTALIAILALLLATVPCAWGGMMGGGYRMGQFKIADLDNDTVPEIVTIVSGTYLVIMDNAGNVKSSNPLPLLPGQTVVRGMAGNLDIADMDGDGVPEIVVTYYLPILGTGNFFGTPVNYGTYLVILDNQGNLKDYKQLQLPYLPY